MTKQKHQIVARGHCHAICYPNPGGDMAYGLIVYQLDNERETCVAFQGGEVIGLNAPDSRTINFATFKSIISTLEMMIEKGFAGQAVEIISDNKYCISKLSFRERPQAEHLVALYDQIRQIRKESFEHIRWTWRPVDQNDAKRFAQESYDGMIGERTGDNFLKTLRF